MMLENYSTPALALCKMYHVEVAQTDLHVFCAQRKIVNQLLAKSSNAFIN